MKSFMTSNLDHPRSHAGVPLYQRLVSACLLAAGLVLGAVNVSVADDTEIFRSTFDAENDEGGRPKVLIIFDNSGSMDGTITTPKPAYDPAIAYLKVDQIESGRLYWATGSSGTPPGTSTGNWINEQRNRCASSFGPLSNQGVYIQRFARWPKSTSTAWAGLSNSSSDRDPLHFDCNEDVTSSNNGNGTGAGAPGNGYPRKASPRPYGSALDSSLGSSSWGTYRLYTANYMNWYYSTTVVAVTRKKIDIAKDVIKNLVSANPGIDFGLEIFNPNTSTNAGFPGDTDGGGYIYRRIIDEDRTEAQRATDTSGLLAKINGLSASTWTPLCESTYEAYRYLAGEAVAYAAKPSGNGPANRDKSAEHPEGTYKSPAGACQFTYIILMTDGMPTRDRSANALVETLTGKTCAMYATDGEGNQKNCLPELTEYMYTHDLDKDSTNGVQRAITYTIGFKTDQALLSDAARRGGGLYYTAESADDLVNAFQGAITSILSTASSFTAPSVAVDTFTRTESRNEVFFAMFEPQEGTDWPGNIKKLRIDIANGDAVLKDANGADAMDGSGKISDGARTYWSSEADGSSVKKGGVGALLAARDPDTRKIWINTGNAGALENLQASNVTDAKFGLANEAALLMTFGVSSRTTLDELLDWARGWEDSSKSSKRAWILGDMLHSRPLVLNYGARGSHTTSDPDIRIVVGTNAGFLHMFNNDDGKEDWAFFPKELAAVLKKRKDNVTGGDVVWGVDGSAMFYSKDLNNDGTIDSAAGDKLYLYFGLRRGGKAYYALDVSNPDSPALLWKIDKDETGFTELGQTWATPVLTYIPGYVDGDGKPKPVLVFGAGYDVGKDDKAAVAGDDGEGRGIFIADATSGVLVWSVTPANNSGTNMKSADLKYSIPAQLTVLDSNGDGLTDRIYATDTGGNIWRVDLPGNSLPSATQEKWFITKLAALNTSGTDSHAGDRRFFYPVDLVRTMSQRDGVFDAVLVGSGDRENPNATDNDDRFYMIRDRNTGIYASKAPTTIECATSQDFRCKLPVTDADLYDISDNLIQTGDADQKSAAEAGLKAAAGWYIDLEAADGEKALARALTIAGTVYFTTFSPGDDTQNLCVPAPGMGRLYAMRLLDGRAVIDFNADSQLDRFAKLGTLIPDTPSPHFGSDKKIRLLFPSGGGLQNMGNPLETGASLRAPFGTYWYNEEF